jgi:hypothetical protein
MCVKHQKFECGFSIFCAAFCSSVNPVLSGKAVMHSNKRVTRVNARCARSEGLLDGNKGSDPAPFYHAEHIQFSPAPASLPLRETALVRPIPARLFCRFGF